MHRKLTKSKLFMRVRSPVPLDTSREPSLGTRGFILLSTGSMKNRLHSKSEDRNMNNYRSYY